jgi:glycosyltransferase involved in cell wall biosynthesis
MLSVVIPVFNARESLVKTLNSVIDNTKNLSEIILVDDHSRKKTQEFIKNFRAPVKLVKVRNQKHSWTNFSWNTGVKLASSENIAVLNSDILLSKDWDEYLIKILAKKTIACPSELVKNKVIKLDPLIGQIDPGMIKGACFMFKKKDRTKLFPIPAVLLHWYGDNYLADRANELKGVGFSSEAVIRHAASTSGNLINKKAYKRRTIEDVKTYQLLSGRDMSLVY